MSENTKPENTNRPLRQLYSDVAPSANLVDRVAKLAEAHDLARTRNARTTRSLRLVAAGAAFAACASVAVVQPRIAAANAALRIAGALSQTRRVAIESWQRRSETDPTRETIRAWYEGTSLRTEDARSTTILTGSREWRYDRATNTATVRNRPNARTPAGFTMDALIDEMRRAGLARSVTIVGRETVGGRTFQVVDALHVEPAGRIRIRLFVDPKTDLPHRYEVSLLGPDTETPIGGGTLRYDEPPAPSRFLPRFGGARVVDLDRETAQWTASLAKPIDSRIVSGRRIALHDARRMDDGSVFILYSVGERNAERALALTDSLGVRYARNPIPFKRPFVVDGANIHGDWFVPLTPDPSRTRGARLTLTIWTGPDSGDEPTAGRERTGRNIAGTFVPNALADRVAFSIAPKVERGAAPSYWRILVADTPLETVERDLRRETAADRASFFTYNERDLPLAIDALREKIALESARGGATEFDRVELSEVLGHAGRIPEGLAAMKDAVRAHESERVSRERSNPGNDPSTYFWANASLAYHILGDSESADAAYRRAIETATDPERARHLRENASSQKSAPADPARLLP